MDRILNLLKSVQITENTSQAASELTQLMKLLENNLYNLYERVGISPYLILLKGKMEDYYGQFLVAADKDKDKDKDKDIAEILRLADPEIRQIF